MRWSHLLIMVVFNVCWAATLPINKALGQWLEPGSIVTLRFLLATVVLAPLWRWLPGPALQGWDWLRAGLMGLLVFCAGQRLQVLGNALGGAGNSAVLMALEPLVTSLLAALILKEVIPWRRWAGFVLGMTGVGLLNGVWRPEFQWTSLTANLIFMSSFVCESGYSILGKPVAQRAGSARILATALLAGTCANLLYDGGETWRAAQSLPWQAWAGLGFMAIVCTVLGYTAWLWVIKETPVSLVVLTIFVQPLAGVPMAAYALGEPLHWGQLWGVLVIGAGLVLGLVEWPERRRLSLAKEAVEN
ncbi:MAG: DMT family transporter [Verrucomicrobiae bacterium]|nr:DMT family transporter [Verrucomicrobiae bacterium]